MIFRKRNTHITTITQHKGEIILSVAKALQRRVIRVSKTFSEIGDSLRLHDFLACQKTKIVQLIAELFLSAG